MAKRVNIDGPGDDPDEYWFECVDCEGTGEVNIPDMPQEPAIDEHGRGPQVLLPGNLSRLRWVRLL